MWKEYHWSDSSSVLNLVASFGGFIGGLKAQDRSLLSLSSYHIGGLNLNETLVIVKRAHRHRYRPNVFYFRLISIGCMWFGYTKNKHCSTVVWSRLSLDRIFRAFLTNSVVDLKKSEPLNWVINTSEIGKLQNFMTKKESIFKGSAQWLKYGELFLICHY